MPLYPVSVKGVIFLRSCVPLLRNERDEWELPGGRLEVTESPEACVVREIEEELGLVVRAEALLDAWLYDVLPGRHVLVLTYGCIAADPTAKLRVSAEHREARLFSRTEVTSLHLPRGYRQFIDSWFCRQASRM
jgi:8-oxo-dGTP pyrophosphatase MutT (NUDIX family)